MFYILALMIGFLKKKSYEAKEYRSQIINLKTCKEKRKP
jgi:hypothetical protein